MKLGFLAGSTGRSGGSYGGLGGSSSGSPNAVYGDISNPNESGSGGATDAPGRLGGSGGGLIRIVAQTLQLDGVIRADGATSTSDCCAGGGSGGGIRIDVGTLSGAGQITANGGGGALSSGGGGGGRIAIYYQNVGGFNFGNVTSQGGTGIAGTNGQNGTIHLQQQVATFLPHLDDATVLRANLEAEPVAGDPVQSAAVRLRSIPDRSQQVIYATVSQPETQHDNLYLAMIARRGSRATSTTAVSGTIDDLDPIYTYDLNGNRVSMIDPTGLTTYAYDALNRLTSITNPKGQTTTFTYDALGRRTSMTRANGAVTTYAYDGASQLTQLVHQLGAATINSFDYAYDRVGNRTTKTSRDGAHDYTYDTLNRLTQAVNPLPTNPLETFNYDPVGNRTSSNQNGASNFNQANQLLEDANFTYQYDNNGNMTRKTAKAGGAVTQYEYDAENKLVRFVSSVGATANYKYDGLGRRVEKEVITGSTTTTRYVYDNEDILLELSGANAIVARYTHGPGIDEPLIMEKNAQSFYYHADGLGSITELTTQTGTVVQRYTYSSFGKIESQLDASFVQPYTFTGRESDSEIGLYHYRARAYDPNTGRFLQEDPSGYAGGSLNLYPYVVNNPTNLIDPSGNIIQLLSPDTYLDLGFLGYDLYRILVDNVLNDCDNLGTNLSSFGGNLAGLAIPGVTGLGAGFRGAKGGTLVIGKLKDLDPGTLQRGEFALEWLNKGSDKSNWQENSRLMREIMSENRPIRDASVDSVTGAVRENTGFLRAERNLLENRGWAYNPQTRHWYPGTSR
jgi:RHS repeat-associated protein